MPSILLAILGVLLIEADAFVMARSELKVAFSSGIKISSDQPIQPLFMAMGDSRIWFSPEYTS
jgi:hypothetical protein